MIRPRLYVGEQTSSKLRGLQQRAQITPNLLCRIGLCLSLEDESPVNVSMYADGNAREFQMSTLLGPQQELYLALLRERLCSDGLIGSVDLNDYLRAHISRGVIQLSNQVSRIEDVVGFVSLTEAEE
jgi:DNA sulfur modification protein DndE